MQIQWYPGHMTKARRMMESKLKITDIIIEVVDARIPPASRNPDFDDLFEKKSRLLILNKSDLADNVITQKWIEYYRKKGWFVLSCNATRKNARKSIIKIIDATAKPQVDRQKARGINKTVRAMVVGIPNVGKSALINCLAPGASAKTGNKPGVTRGAQVIRISPFLELLDTPGILWPKLENKRYARHLAYTGAIRDEVLDTYKLCMGLLEELRVIAPQAVLTRYKLTEYLDVNEDMLESICRKRGWLISGGEYDWERGSKVFLKEYRNGILGPISLENPGDTVE